MLEVHIVLRGNCQPAMAALAAGPVTNRRPSLIEHTISSMPSGRKILGFLCLVIPINLGMIATRSVNRA